MEDIRKLPQLSKDSKNGNSILGLWIKANENGDTEMIKKTIAVMIENGIKNLNVYNFKYSHKIIKKERK